MNITIIISFVIMMGMITILLMPRKVALRISGINRYDLQTVPKRTVFWVYTLSILVLCITFGLFIYETSLFEGDITALIDWVKGLFQ